MGGGGGGGITNITSSFVGDVTPEAKRRAINRTNKYINKMWVCGENVRMPLFISLLKLN